MQEVFEKIIGQLESKAFERYGNKGMGGQMVIDCDDAIEIVKQAAEEFATDINAGYSGWIPVKYHVVTDREREEKCISEDIVYYLDCNMPDDGEQIIVTDGENMWSDICYVDTCYSLDSGHDWIDDVVAWRAMPEKYQQNGK